MKLAPPPITTLPCIPPGVVAAYVEAHGTCAILPGHALVQVRGALAALVEAWLRHLARGTGGTLADQTARLVSLLRLPDVAARALYEVRVAGNLGAHPEQRLGGPPTRTEARDALFALHGLVSLFAERVGGLLPDSLPPFAEPPEVHWGDVCERAIFERDAAAMLAVGRRHRTQALEANREAEGTAKAEQSSMRFVDRGGFQEALDWFQRAMLNTLDSEVRRQAWFEQARLLLTELRGHKRAGEATDLLRWSAEDGVADAQSMLALLILDATSPFPEPRDLGEARDWAERAAEAEHPEALNVLTAIYGNGQGVERDPLRAIGYARRASQAGYPLAHANLALLLLDQPAEVRDDGEIRAAIDRAKQAGIGHGYWAEYRFLDDKGLAGSPEAAEALRVAAKEQVVAGMLVSAQQAMHAEPPAWELSRIAGWLIGILGSMGANEERVEARDMLVKVRDEGSRRMRSPDARAARESVDDLFNIVLQAGSCLDLQPGEDPFVKIRTVMDALLRLMMSRPGEPATRVDVELLLSAMPDFQVRWTGTKAELSGTAAMGARAMRGEAPTPPLGQSEPRAARPMPARRPSRNGPCPCGSGKKFKGCCGRDDRSH
jgi:TPR repeat protein